MNGMPSRNHALCCLLALASAAVLAPALVRAAPPDDVAAAPSGLITGVGGNGAIVQGRVQLETDDPAAIPQPRQLRPVVQPHTVIEDGQLLLRRGDGSFEAIQLQRGPANRLRQLLNNPSDPTSQFAIGLVLDQNIDLARAQLHLGETGVAVRHVVPELPAAKAGIEQHDIIIAAGDREVTSAKVLHEVIDETGENELTLTILRGGVEQTVAVTPKRREELQAPRNDGRPELFSPDSPTDPENRLPGGGFPWRGIPEEFSPPGRSERQIREMRQEINTLKERVDQLEQMIEKLTSEEQPTEE